MSSKSRSRSTHRHNPLADDLVATGHLKVKSNKRKAKPEGQEERFVDARSSRKILKIGQELLEEDGRDGQSTALNPAFAFASRPEVASEPEDEPHPDDAEGWDDEGGETVEEVVCCLDQGDD